MAAMSWGRGLFRVWVVLAGLWFCTAIVLTSPDIWTLWKLAQTMKQFEGAELGSTLVPVDCGVVRGREGADYEHRDGKCWYKLPKIRALFPEYRDLDDETFVTRAYRKAGSDTLWAIGQSLLFGAGIPIVVLLIGGAIGWALRGFAPVASG
jgi:hypothetical protein